MKHTTKWFRRADMEAWLDNLAHLRERPTRYLEIGLFEGRSFCWVMDNLLVHEDSVGVGVDPWVDMETTAGKTPKEIEKTARKNIEQYGAKARIIKERSRFYLAMAADAEGKFDLIYIDGSHRLEDVWVDTGLAWQCLAGGGVLVWDDYKYSIKRSVDLFVELVEAEVVWKTRRQAAVRKGVPRCDIS